MNHNVEEFSPGIFNFLRQQKGLPLMAGGFAEANALLNFFERVDYGNIPPEFQGTIEKIHDVVKSSIEELVTSGVLKDVEYNVYSTDASNSVNEDVAYIHLISHAFIEDNSEEENKLSSAIHSISTTLPNGYELRTSHEYIYLMLIGEASKALYLATMDKNDNLFRLFGPDELPANMRQLLSNTRSMVIQKIIELSDDEVLKTRIQKAQPSNKFAGYISNRGNTNEFRGQLMVIDFFNDFLNYPYFHDQSDPEKFDNNVYGQRYKSLLTLLPQVVGDIGPSFESSNPGMKLEIPMDERWEGQFDNNRPSIIITMSPEVISSLISHMMNTPGLKVESGKPTNDDEPDKSVEKKKQGQKEKYPVTGHISSFEEHGDMENARKGNFEDLPKELQTTLRKVHGIVSTKIRSILKGDRFKTVRNTPAAMKNIDAFTSPLQDKGKIGSFQVWPKGKSYECMIQLMGHFKNHQESETDKLLHKLVKETYQTLKSQIQKDHGIRLDNEGTGTAGFEGFDAYPSAKVAEQVWNVAGGEPIKESGEKAPTPEYNTDMTEAQAKKTLGTLTASIIADFEKNKNYKVSQYTMNIYANIITKNLLPIWAKGWKKFTLTANTDNYHNNLANVEFLTPPFTQDFVSRFIHGRESLNGHLRRRPEIRMKITSGIFRDMKHRDDAYNFFKEAIRYYDSQVEKGAKQLMSEVMKLGHNMKHLIGNSKLSGLVTLPLTLLFKFDNVNMGERGTFKLKSSDVQAVNKFVRNICSRYAAPEKEKREIIDDVKTMIGELREYCGLTEDIRELGYFPEALEMFYFGGFKDMILESSKQFIDAQVDNKYIPESMQSRFMYEKWGVKRLKKIPRDLVAYITIETEAIKDSNDKMMISSYCLGKLEIVEWYLELLEVGSKKYIVPHPKSYLDMMRTELLNCFNNIMKVKVPGPNRPLIQIQYPTGYEG